MHIPNMPNQLSMCCIDIYTCTVYIHVHVYNIMCNMCYMYNYIMYMYDLTLLSFLACVARVCASWNIVDDPLDLRLDRTVYMYACMYMYN